MVLAAALPYAAHADHRALPARGPRRLRARVQRVPRLAARSRAAAADAAEQQRRFVLIRLGFNDVLSQFDLFTEVDHPAQRARDRRVAVRPRRPGPRTRCGRAAGLEPPRRSATSPAARARRSGGPAPGCPAATEPGGDHPGARGSGWSAAASRRRWSTRSGTRAPRCSGSWSRCAPTSRRAAEQRPAGMRGRPGTGGSARSSRTAGRSARSGSPRPLGLLAVVSLPAFFVFRPSGDDPHPVPYLRVLVSATIGEALYPHPQWAAMRRHLEARSTRSTTCRPAAGPSWAGSRRDPGVRPGCCSRTARPPCTAGGSATSVPGRRTPARPGCSRLHRDWARRHRGAGPPAPDAGVRGHRPGQGGRPAHPRGGEPRCCPHLLRAWAVRSSLDVVQRPTQPPTGRSATPGVITTRWKGHYRADLVDHRIRIRAGQPAVSADPARRPGHRRGDYMFSVYRPSGPTEQAVRRRSARHRPRRCELRDDFEPEVVFTDGRAPRRLGRQAGDRHASRQRDRRLPPGAAAVVPQVPTQTVALVSGRSAAEPATRCCGASSALLTAPAVREFHEFVRPGYRAGGSRVVRHRRLPPAVPGRRDFLEAAADPLRAIERPRLLSTRSRATRGDVRTVVRSSERDDLAQPFLRSSDAGTTDRLESAPAAVDPAEFPLPNVPCVELIWSYWQEEGCSSRP